MATVETLLAALRGRTAATGPELAARLRVSQPTLSRLIRSAGSRVCRMGRARATRYAATRTLAGLGSEVPVWRVDEAGTTTSHGTLHLLVEDRYLLRLNSGAEELFEGLPPFLWDMSPQGFLGRHFANQYPELGLPPRLLDWTNEQRLLAVARRGPDCAGDLILGQESLDTFLAHPPQAVARTRYPDLARQAQNSPAGSSAGGEHPKFAAYSGGRHVLVKFALAEPGPATERWHDLLRCEQIALATAAEAGIARPGRERTGSGSPSIPT